MVIYKDYGFLSDPNEQSHKSKSDSLLAIGNYWYKKYTLDDLEKNKWQITYPDDGFKEGKSK